MDAIPLELPQVSAYTVPTPEPESDGTLEWDSTTLVLVEIGAGSSRGLGYTYAGPSTATLIRGVLAKVVEGRNALDIAGAWSAMLAAIRNLGRPGVAATAISAVDNALWDLKAKLLDLPLCKLLGMLRDGVPAYGSGGFTSYSEEQLCKQLDGWAENGMRMVKMKVGRDPQHDRERVCAARKAIGEDVQLFVDANGAYARKQALHMAHDFAACGVSWFEEPVSSDDLAGLRMLRDRAPAEIDITAGEYGYDPWYFRRMLDAGAVDVLQADATRCLGITGFIKVAALCEAFQLPFSAHCAPALHLHPCCAAAPLRHVEYFHDHVRVERMLFDGATQPTAGVLHPDLSRPGLGIELKAADAERYQIAL